MMRCRVKVRNYQVPIERLSIEHQTTFVALYYKDIDAIKLLVELETV